MFSTVSIMPGMDTSRPDRTATSSGLFGSPNFLPVAFSTLGDIGPDFVHQPLGSFLAEVVVFAAGFGGDGEAGRHRQRHQVMSARLAPLPPSRSFMMRAAFGFAVAEEVDALDTV
jgi:hypothetical protein